MCEEYKGVLCCGDCGASVRAGRFLYIGQGVWNDVCGTQTIRAPTRIVE